MWVEVNLLKMLLSHCFIEQNLSTPSTCSDQYALQVFTRKYFLNDNLIDNLHCLLEKPERKLAFF